METTAGYREIEHTADWELEVWAPDMPSLLEQAARGMMALSHTTLQPGPRVQREITVDAADDESLLVGFLSELLYITEMESIAFDGFDLRLEGDRLHAKLSGAPVEAADKEIKAVTYHNLRVRRENGGLRVNIVFDV
jgi:SHS2 domain-containing protein